ncbi:MAG: hypothetical protein K0B52_06635 [FCB group bacterium]|nr:hypothetical protein [FCB group bacterium]
MKKRFYLFSFIVAFILTACATKSFVLEENLRVSEQMARTDSLLQFQLHEQQFKHEQMQDSLFLAIQKNYDALLLEFMAELYEKNYKIDSMQHVMQEQGRYIDDLMMNVDTLQSLQTRFEDADYSIFNFSQLKITLDSLMINQRHLSRELQYMIRDLNLIERNMMDIINYSSSSLKAQLQAALVDLKQSIYRNNATAYKMIMIYLMSNVSSEPEKLLKYIDSVYGMGDALDTVQVQFRPPGSGNADAVPDTLR